ncbi:MAG: putative ABC transport system permease protein, partial [bacterium]
KRFKLKLGDTLSFDVQGISIQGKIVNFRSVRWNSFQPNFFILFQTGVLESAPQTFLASIAKVKKSRKGALQNGIVKQFPNVSMVDVSKIVDKLLDIAGRMSWAIQSMAYLSIVAGLVVVYSIARTEARTRNWEINLLKVLGASFQDIRKIILIEFGVLGLFAAFFGIILSVAVSSILSYFLFSNIWEFSWGMNLFSFIVIGMISMTTALFATYDIIRQKPWKILKAS